jgi:hypothetical protein
MNQRLAEKRELLRNTSYRAVTAAEVRQHGLCKGKHKGMGYWRLFCGCMTHPKGVSVVQLLGTWVWRIARKDEEPARA